MAQSRAHFHYRFCIRTSENRLFRRAWLFPQVTCIQKVDSCAMSVVGASTGPGTLSADRTWRHRRPFRSDDRFARVAQPPAGVGARRVSAIGTLGKQFGGDGASYCPAPQVFALQPAGKPGSAKVPVRRLLEKELRKHPGTETCDALPRPATSACFVV